MDTRRWGDPKSRRCFRIFLLLCFCLQHLHHVTASGEDYSALLENQGLSENQADSRNKHQSFSQLHPFNSEADEDYKRSSSFFPLRGKKLSAADIDAAHYPFMSLQADADDKRSQFYPLRGKKVPDDLKRGSYFMPMRGRKDDESWSEDDFQEDSLDKRMSSFMPMRGKKKSGLLDSFPHLGKPGMYSTDIMYPSSSGSNREKRSTDFLTVEQGQSTLEDSSGTNETSPDHSVLKRSVSFVPMRGRRELESLSPQEIKTRLLEKKEFSFVPMRGRRYSFTDANDSLPFDPKAGEDPEIVNSGSQSTVNGDGQGHPPALDIDTKRASAFMPMRGRKTYDDDVASMEYDTAAQEDKRGSSFMPMRGRREMMKNILSNSGDREMDTDSKRASSFMPMRGRRIMTQMIGNTHHDIDTDSKRASSFMPMRGRKQMMDDVTHHDTDTDSKRVASFMPMRGRRKLMEALTNFEDQGATNYDEDPDDKRASSFMPMRGRREWMEDHTNLNNQGIDPDGKRASSFMPMRGRRAEDDLATGIQMDSAGENPSSYVLMHGQRINTRDSSVESVLDRRSSSFMPMRGRRDPSENLTQFTNDLEGEDKRGSYFMPMRGRRGLFDGSESTYFFNSYPFIVPYGVGSSLMTRHYNGRFYPVSSTRRVVAKGRKFDWDSVKRAFHATRGKRDPFQEDSTGEWEYKGSEASEQSQDSNSHHGKGCRYKRSILRPRMLVKPQRQYIALKRPMSFFATRGKRLDDSAIDTVSKLH